MASRSRLTLNWKHARHLERIVSSSRTLTSRLGSSLKMTLLDWTTFVQTWILLKCACLAVTTIANLNTCAWESNLVMLQNFRMDKSALIKAKSQQDSLWESWLRTVMCFMIERRRTLLSGLLIAHNFCIWTHQLISGKTYTSRIALFI